MPLTIDHITSAAAALALVTGLVLLGARLARAAGLARFAGPKRSRHRLSVEDSLPLDRARRLLLVRCDGRDLLLLTGGPVDVVIGWQPDAGSLPARAGA